MLGHPRGTQRYTALAREDEDELTTAIIALAGNYGRYGYRRITALLQAAGWDVGTDRVQRIWRREGLKVPQKQKPRGRLWLNDGSCILIEQWRNHYNTLRPHSALGYRPPAPQVIRPNMIHLDLAA